MPKTSSCQSFLAIDNFIILFIPFLLPLLVHYPIQSNTMDTNPLTRVEIWHLENVLFKLYRTIQSCVDSIDPGLINLFDFSDSMTWIDKDTLITEFFEKPQYYEYGGFAVVELSKENFIRLHNFIIENQDIGHALDLTEQELNLHSFIIFLKGLNENIDGCLSSITYLEMLRDFRYEIYKWACFHANRIGSTIDCELKRRQEVTSLIAENLDSIHIKYPPLKHRAQSAYWKTPKQKKHLTSSTISSTTATKARYSKSINRSVSLHTNRKISTYPKSFPSSPVPTTEACCAAHTPKR